MVVGSSWLVTCSLVMLTLKSVAWGVALVVVSQGLAASDPEAVAQFMNGRFQVIYPDGRVREFENRAYFFTVSRFSADGQAIIGSLGRDLVVLNESFEILWKVRPSNPNILNMALSPSKTQMAFIAGTGGRISRWV